MPSPHNAPPFAVQRSIFFAMLISITLFSIGAGLVIEFNGGEGILDEPLPMLDLLVAPVAGTMTLGALLLRGVMLRGAEQAEDCERAMARFRARLVALAVLEAAAMFAVGVWVVNGTKVPALFTAMIVLAIAIATTPFRDPDEGLR